MKRKVHMFREFTNGKNRAWCGRFLSATENLADPFGERVAETTCVDCLRARVHTALFRLWQEGETARDVYAALGRVLRAQNRAKRKEAPNAK